MCTRCVLARRSKQGLLPDALFFTRSMKAVKQPTLAPPVDKLKMVTTAPKARATMNDTTLRTLVPPGTPLVLHLYSP